MTPVQMCKKITCNNPKLDLVNMYAYIPFGENMSVSSQDIERKQILAYIKYHNSGTNVRKMGCNNPKLDPAKMNAYIKFGEILPNGSQDIEGQRNFGIKKGP